MAHNKGFCSLLHLREDNARFILLAIVMVIYMVSGAAVFMLLESANEQKEREAYYQLLEQFCNDHPEINSTELNGLLTAHWTAATAGLLKDKRRRWDFAGSFYFVGTVVSTIGFGMTTPRTIPGKLFLILYGFMGCAGAILFFNLFLERIITFLAYILRSIHERELKRKGLMSRERANSQISDDEDDDSLDSWKPSVYWVMLILFLSACVIACCASAMYTPVEKWTYFEAIYFCFVTFATIGFGDYVVSQEAYYDYVYLYRFGNFCFIVIGCCCIYSLFNVTSIVIKQFLNWLIKKLDCQCCYPKPKPAKVIRRNAITPGILQKREKTTSEEFTDADDYDSDCSRRNSGEMISMHDFLQANKISLAMMQKQLYETAQRGAFASNGGGFQDGVGPLQILNKKLGHDE